MLQECSCACIIRAYKHCTFLVCFVLPNICSPCLETKEHDQEESCHSHTQEGQQQETYLRLSTSAHTTLLAQLSCLLATSTKYSTLQTEPEDPLGTSSVGQTSRALHVLTGFRAMWAPKGGTTGIPKTCKRHTHRPAWVQALGNSFLPDSRGLAPKAHLLRFDISEVRIEVSN